MAALRDGLGIDMVEQSGLAGPDSNHAYFLGSVTSESTIKGLNLSDGRGQLGPIGTGSPSTWGLGMQAGVASGTNVAVVVTFGTPFKTAPNVVTQLLISGAQATTAGCIVGPTALGSFVFLGTSGAPYSWLAVGSL